MTEVINPALVAAHARAWIGVPHVRCGKRREVGADCAGLVAGIYAELTARILPPPVWRGDPAGADTSLVTALARHGELWRGCPTRPGLVAVFRDFGRHPHVGVLSDDGLIHAADYAGRVVLDGWSGAHLSSLWVLHAAPGCVSGPEGLDVGDCVAVIHRTPSPGAGVFAEIQAPDGAVLARTRRWPDVGAALQALSPIYQHIETVE